MCPLNFQAFLESIRRSRGYRGQIVHVERIPARKAQYAEIAPPLPREIEETLKRQGITRLYSHQAEAIEAVRRGEHVIVVTSTASGKTLCYNAPVFETLLVNPCARALYIYPTKALAQDQLAKLRLLQEGLFTAPASQEGEESVSYTHKGEHYSLTLAKEGRRKALTKEGVSAIRAYTYDGDTPRQDRPFIKSVSNIVLTNPDMLHVGILPYHTTWSDLFRNLHYVVIDEAHTYRGVFGAHVANIIRRLRRIAEYYGSRPQFVCASATVREPAKLAKDLTGLEARVIENDGSPSGEKTFVFWNPPMLDSKGERRSSNYEAVELFTRLVESGVRTIVFTRARKTAELILRYAKKELREAGSSNVEKIMSYRAGYRPSERRDIERRLFSGELLGVTSTSALEVGVDIGGLDAVVMTGYPGS
ncbi:MAG: DEAD/DEAH box helicase, partial [Armatimonadetes bacterium]|nr:DEAD/DEAH box helicase [Armatimonadota bacterium]